MGNRCPDCNKFVGLEIGEPEVQNVDLTDFIITAEVRLPLNCSECGGELAEYVFNFEETLPEEALLAEGEDFSHLSIEEGDCDAFDEYRSRKPPKIDKKTGKPRYVPIRYQTHYYGVNLQVIVTNSETNETYETILSDEAEGSAFDSLV